MCDALFCDAGGVAMAAVFKKMRRSESKLRGQSSGMNSNSVIKTGCADTTATAEWWNDASDGAGRRSLKISLLCSVL